MQPRSSVNSRGGPRTSLALVRAAGIEPALPIRETDFKSVASTGFATLARFSVSASRPQKPADLLHLAQHGKGDRAGALSATAQHAIDITRIGHQPGHLAADTAQHLDCKLGQRLL